MQKGTLDFLALERGIKSFKIKFRSLDNIVPDFYNEISWLLNVLKGYNG